jgi:DNA-binding NtrC family response regulator
LLEAELFGYVPGAFTGAESEHAGLLERCDGGTLVLDHIDELPPPLQGKLLRVLDDGRFRPVGGDRERRVTIRLIATVREPPSVLVASGRLRPEIYYRLQGLESRVPPLRERREEIEPLLEVYLAVAARSFARPIPSLSPETLRRLEEAQWPGNVRELVNCTQRWAIEGRNVLLADELAGAPPERLGEGAAPPAWSGEDWRSETDRFHRQLLAEALERFGGNQTQTALALGVSRRHLQNLLNKLGFRDHGESSS